MLTEMASVAQSVEHWSRDPWSRVQFPVGGLGVVSFATGPGWVLKCISFRHSNLSYGSCMLVSIPAIPPPPVDPPLT